MNGLQNGFFTPHRRCPFQEASGEASGALSTECLCNSTASVLLTAPRGRRAAVTVLVLRAKARLRASARLWAESSPGLLPEVESVLTQGELLENGTLCDASFLILTTASQDFVIPIL